jgi:hypothetical protein
MAALYQQTLGYFRDYEDAVLQKQVIGDQFGATRIYRPVDGLQAKNLTRVAAFPLQIGFESSVRAGKIWRFLSQLRLHPRTSTRIPR